MLLTLDVGNSQIFCGVYDGEQLRTTFRRTSGIRASSDEFGTFFRAMLRENGVDPGADRYGRDLFSGAGRRTFPAKLFPEVLPLRAVSASAGSEDRAEDPLSQPAGGGRRQNCKRNWSARSISRPESADRRFWHGDHGVRRHEGQRVSRRNHHAGDSHIHGGAGIADRAPAGGGDRSARGSSGSLHRGKHPVGLVLRHSGYGAIPCSVGWQGALRRRPAADCRDGGIWAALRGGEPVRRVCARAFADGLRRAVELSEAETKRRADAC